MTIGERLKRLREAQGLTLEQAGAIAGTSKQSMSQIEKGVTKEPGGLALYKWAQYYRVDLKWLITGQGPRTTAEAAPLQGSQSVGIDPEILADAMKLLRATDAILGEPPEASIDPYRIADCYQAILEVGGSVNDGNVIDFNARLAKKLRETADHGAIGQDDSGTGGKAGGTHRPKRGARSA